MDMIKPSQRVPQPDHLWFTRVVDVCVVLLFLLGAVYLAWFAYRKIEQRIEARIQQEYVEMLAKRDLNYTCPKSAKYSRVYRVEGQVVLTCWYDR